MLASEVAQSQELKAMAFSDYVTRPGAAAELPQQLVDDLITAVQKTSTVLTLGRQVPVATRDSRVPVVSQLPDASWITGTDPDVGMKSVTNMAITNQQLIAEECATIAVVPQSVVEDSGFDLWGAIRPELANAIARAFDQAVLFGVNAPTTFPPSLVQQAVTAGNVVTGDLYAENADNPGMVLQSAMLVAMQGYVPTGVATAPGWNFRSSVARTQQLVSNPIGADQPFPLTLGGLGIKPDPITWQAPATGSTDAITAAWNYVLVGMRRDITIEAFDTGVISDTSGVVVQNLLMQDLAAVRVTFRAGYYLACPPTGYDVATLCPVAVVQNSGSDFPLAQKAEAEGRHAEGRQPEREHRQPERQPEGEGMQTQTRRR
jgi:Phage capsid family